MAPLRLKHSTSRVKSRLAAPIGLHVNLSALESRRNRAEIATGSALESRRNRTENGGLSFRCDLPAEELTLFQLFGAIPAIQPRDGFS